MHLTKRYLKKSGYEVPMEIKRYKESKIFKNEKILPSKVTDKPFISKDVALDSDEIEVLGLPPSYGVFANLGEEYFEVDLEQGFAKYRYSKHKDDTEGMDEDFKVTEEEQQIIDENEAESRQVYDPGNKTLDLRKKRATDVKHNTRVHLPRALNTKVEAGIEIRRQEYMRVHNEYTKEFCDEKCNQQSNLSQSQRSGLKKLKNRIKNGEIIVCMTDKSGKLAVLSMQEYLKAGAVHTDKDEEVDLEFVKQTQRILNGHTAMWIKITNMGADWKHQDRHRETHINNSSSVCPMYLLLKDHKVYNPDDGPPPTRPVCGSVTGMNVHFSNIISDLLEALASAREDTAESISSEDFLSKFDRFNKKVDEGMETNDGLGSESDSDDGGYHTDEEEFDEQTDCTEEETVIVGADAKALYPSMEGDITGTITKLVAMNTTANFDHGGKEETLGNSLGHCRQSCFQNSYLPIWRSVFQPKEGRTNWP